MKKLFGMLLLVCFLIYAVPICALSVADGDYEYDVRGDKVTITKYTGSAVELPVPSTLAGKPVVAIGDKAFEKKGSLTKVILPESITSIGEEAFAYCQKLKEINLPASLQMIGYRAFFDCESLESVYLPDSLTEMGDQAFSICPKLSNVRLSNNLEHIPKSAFSECAIQSLDIPSNIKILEDGAFSLSGLREITGMQGVTEIGEHVFSDNNSLQCLELPKGLKRISVSALPSNEKFKNGGADDGLHYAGSLDEWMQVDGYAAVEENGYTVYFKDGSIYPEQSNGSDYEYTVLEDNTVRIDKYKGSARDLVVPRSFEDKKVSVIGKKAFQLNQTVETLILPDGITTIESRAFSQAAMLRAVRLPETLTKLEEYAFAECASLESISLPNSLTDLAWQTFSNCTKLTYVQLPDTLRIIPQAAFSECVSLQAIHIPSSVVMIEDYALNQCDLQIISGMENVEEIGYGAFESNSGLQRVDLPKSLHTINKHAMPGLQSGGEWFRVGSYATGMHYDGTTTQWKEVKGSAYYLEDGYTVYCRDGAIMPDGTVEDYAALILDTPAKNDWPDKDDLPIANMEVWYAGSQAVLRIIEEGLPDGFENPEYIWYDYEEEIKPDDMENLRRGNTVPIEVQEGVTTYTCRIDANSDSDEGKSLLVFFEVTGTKPVLGQKKGNDQECRPGDKISSMEAEWLAGPPIKADGSAWPVRWEKDGSELTGADGLAYIPPEPEVMGEKDLTYIAKCMGLEDKILAKAEFFISKQETEASPIPTTTPSESAPPTPSDTLGPSSSASPNPTATRSMPPVASPSPTRTIGAASSAGNSDYFPYLPSTATATPPAPTLTPTTIPTPSTEPEPYVIPAKDASVKFATGEGIIVPGIVLSGFPIETGSETYSRAAFERDAEYPDAYNMEILDREGNHLAEGDPMATGHTVRLVNARGQVRWTSTVIVAGDVLGTGKHSIAQLSALAQSIAGKDNLSEPYLEAGDLNRNKRTEISDLAGSARMLTA